VYYSSALAQPTQMNPRPIIYASSSLLILAIGWGWWSASRPPIPRQDSVLRPTASPGPSDSAVGKQVPVPYPVAVDPGPSASAIVSRGAALQEENRQVREKLAAGDFSALPETLKVADLPLETAPPQAVPASPVR
jgi:hypothetical protein